VLRHAGHSAVLQDRTSPRSRHQSRKGTAVVVAVYAFLITMVILKVMNAIHPIRVSEAVKAKGLDMGEFGEQAY
jgi:ammonia channel protein AmtB